MTEALRKGDDGTEQRPFGRNTLCRTCQFGKAWVQCQHNWRHPFDPLPPDTGAAWSAEKFVKGPVRIYVVNAICTNEAMSDPRVDGGPAFPVMHDVVTCELFEPRADA